MHLKIHHSTIFHGFGICLGMLGIRVQPLCLWPQQRFKSAHKYAIILLIRLVSAAPKPGSRIGPETPGVRKMPKKDEKLKVEVRQKALVSQQGSLLLPQISCGFHARRDWTADVLRKNLAIKLNLDGSEYAGICAQLQIRVVGKEDTEVPEDQCMGTLYDQNRIRDTLHLILKDESSSVEQVQPVAPAGPVEAAEPPVEPPVAPVGTPVALVEAVVPVEPVPVEEFQSMDVAAADEAVNASEVESQAEAEQLQAQLAQTKRQEAEWELLTQEQEKKRSESQAQLFREEIHEEKTESAEVKAALSKAQAQIADLENEKLQLRDRVSKMAKEWSEEKKEKDMAVQEQDRCTGAMHRMEKERRKEETMLRALERDYAEQKDCGILRVIAFSAILSYLTFLGVQQCSI